MPDRSYEDEIRDLLEKMNNFVPEEPRTVRARRRIGRFGDRIRPRLLGLRRRFLGVRPSQQLVLLGILLVVAALFVRALVPVVGSLLGLAGVLLFAIGYVLSLVGVGRGRQEVRWRGRIVELRRRPWWQEWLLRLWRLRRR